MKIRNLGDCSATYQVSALLKDVNNLIDKRRELRARTMDVLHAEGIEIVSPSFMNTRALEKDQTFISDVADEATAMPVGASPDAIAFDKATRAASVSKLRETLADTEARIRACDEVIGSPPNTQALEAAQAEKEQLTERVERLSALIARKAEKISQG